MTASDRVRQREQKDVHRVKAKLRSLAKRVRQTLEREWNVMDVLESKELESIATRLEELGR